MQRLTKNWKLTFLILTLAAVTAFYLPMLEVKFYFHIKHEFNNHVTFAIWMLESPERLPLFLVAHPLYPLLVAGVIRLAGLAPKAAGTLISLAAYLGLAWVIYSAAYRRLDHGVKTGSTAGNTAVQPAGLETKKFSSRIWTAAWSSGITLALMLLSQIPVMFLVDRLFYFGYIGINVYLNSTSNMMKPLAVLGYFLALRAFHPARRSWAETGANALVTILSTLNKPNFIICFLPALGGLALVQLVWSVLCPEVVGKKTIAWRSLWAEFNRRVDWKLLLFGIFIPAAGVLVWQYSVTYLEGESKIELAPFQLMGYYSSNLLPKFLGSVLFPLSLAGVYFKKMRRDNGMLLAWFIFLLGAFYTYFMTTNAGGRYKDGNFYWSGEIALFVLFVASTIFWVESLLAAGRPGKGDIILLLIFALHLVSGLMYYTYSFLVDDYDRLGSWRNLLEGF